MSFDIDMMVWVWGVLALIFFVGEMFTAGFVIACFGFGAVAAAILAFLGVGLAGQIVAFIVVSGITVALALRYAQSLADRPVQQVAGDRMLGKQAEVTVAIPAGERGNVRVDAEDWRAREVDGRAVTIGTWVEVLSVDGTHLVVRAPAADADAGG